MVMEDVLFFIYWRLAEWLFFHTMDKGESCSIHRLQKFRVTHWKIFVYYLCVEGLSSSNTSQISV